MVTPLYLDTEFNGHGGSLISMALVSGHPYRYWYEVIDIPDNPDPWVKENVLPKLEKPAIGLKAARASLHSFLLKFKDPLVVCDWHADVQHFCAMLSGDDFGTSLDYGCKFLLLSGPSDVRPTVPHNALSDAHALMVWHQKEVA
jgi:hypothetical protein